MSVMSAFLDLARYLRERKGVKEEQRRYEQEWPLKEQTLKTQLAQAKQGLASMTPGRPEQQIRGPMGQPFTIPGQEPGLGYKQLQQEVSAFKTPEELMELRLKEEERRRKITGAETPTETRTAETELEETKRLAKPYFEYQGIMISAYNPDGTRKTDQQIMDEWGVERDRLMQEQFEREKELTRLGRSEKEKVGGPFDEQGNFDVQYFFDVIKERDPMLTFYDLEDRERILQIKEKIRRLTIAKFGQTPEQKQAIERALDEWVEALFELSKMLPEEDKKRPIIEAIQKGVEKKKELKETGYVPPRFAEPSPLKGIFKKESETGVMTGEPSIIEKGKKALDKLRKAKEGIKAFGGKLRFW